MKRSSTSNFKQYESPNKVAAPDTDLSLIANRPRSNGFPTHSNFGSDANTSTMNTSTNSVSVPRETSFRRRDASITEKTYLFTGTAERVLAWNRVCKHRCFFEVIASLVSIRESRDNLHNIVLLKDKKGPILQVIHYFDHEMLEKEFSVGQMLRCVGYTTGLHILTAVSIRRALPEEVAALKRHCYFGDFTISGLIKSESGQ